MFNLFKKKKLKQPIEIGSKWKLKPDKGDPWPQKNSSTIYIVDAKQGWVRYSIGKGSLFNDERLREETFRFCYTPAEI